MSSNEPLWSLMLDAYDNSTVPNGGLDGWTDRHGYAAEIRAIVTALQSRPRYWPERDGEIIAWLIAEAARAEAGK
jgi:hypothetical protein